MTKIKEKTRLTLLKIIKEAPNAIGLYKCECGNTKKVRVAMAKGGFTLSCGCLFKERFTTKTHGLRHHPLYKVWGNIKNRCNNKNSTDYYLYGGRGIAICKEWESSFESFYNWCMNNGWRQGLQIDKDIKGCMVYSPDNCTIVSNKVNGNNRRNNVYIQYEGVSKTLTEWGEKYGISHYTIRARMKKMNWSFERSITTPLLK